MAFGEPTKYWQLDISNCSVDKDTWDKAVEDASQVYSGRVELREARNLYGSSGWYLEETYGGIVYISYITEHNLLFDNCHSHVAMALNTMQYKGSDGWNMLKLAALMLIHGKYISVVAAAKTWLPFCLVMSTIAIVTVLVRLRT